MAPRIIFVNLCVSDIVASTSFYESVGAVKNATFSSDTVSCMVFSESIYVMIMAPDQFKEYVPKEKEIADSKKTSEVLICITVENHEDVDNIVNAAVKSGGMADPTILPQMPNMHGRSFEDLDGHVWELMWMDMEAAKAQNKGEAAKKSEGGA